MLFRSHAPVTRNSIIDRNPRGFALVAGVGVALVGLPLVGLLARVDWSRFVSLLGDKTVRDALWLSLVSSLVATVIAVVSFGLGFLLPEPPAEEAH